MKNLTSNSNYFLQRDIIKISFDPSRGTEIKKRRPALVISKNNYNKSHSQVILCPITSTKKEAFYLVPLKDPVEQNLLIEGSKVNTSQIYTFDITKQGKRNPQRICRLNYDEYLYIQQLIFLNFTE